MFSGKVKELEDSGLRCLVMCFFLNAIAEFFRKKKSVFTCWLWRNLKYFCFKYGLIRKLFLHLKKKKKSAKDGGRERARLIHFTAHLSAQPVLMHSKARPRVRFLRKGPFWLDLVSPSSDWCFSSQGGNLSLGSRRDPTEPTLICSHCHLVDYKGYWFSSNSHFNVAFYGKCTLAKDCWVPHRKDPGLFSNTSLLSPHFIYDSDESVFSGNTHFTFWPRSIC